MADEQTQALVPAAAGALVAGDLELRRDPSEVIAEAAKAAKALQALVDGQPPERKLVLGGQTYIRAEDWAAIASFYGVTARITDTRYVSYQTHGGDMVVGFEADAEAVHVSSGRVVSRASALCLTDEPKWRDRAKYEWAYVKKSGGTSLTDPGKAELVWEPSGKDPKKMVPKRVKVLAASEPVPLFQLRSMAQTRAGSKAIVLGFRWHVALAGYATTPAEEIEGTIIEGSVVPKPENGHAEPVTAQDTPQTAQAAPQATKSEPGEADDRLISEPQQKRLFALAKAAKRSDDEVRAILTEWGYAHSREIRRLDYEQICSEITGIL